MKTRTALACAVAAAAFVGLTLLAAEGVFKDGVYKGSAKGHKGPIEVEVTVKDSKISDVKILSQTEDRPLKALEEIPRQIVERQSADVDAVTGATHTSDGIKKAVKKALDIKTAAVKTPAKKGAAK